MNGDTDPLVDDVMRGCADMLLDAHPKRGHGMCACGALWPCERAMFALGVVGPRNLCQTARAVTTPGAVKVAEYYCAGEAGHEGGHDWRPKEKD